MRAGTQDWLSAAWLWPDSAHIRLLSALTSYDGHGRWLGLWLWAVRQGSRWHRRTLLFLTSIYVVQVCIQYPDPVTEAELRPSVTNVGWVTRGPLTSGARRSYFYCPRLQCVWRDQVPLIVLDTGRWWTPVSRLSIVLLPPLPPPLHSWPVSRHPVNGWMAARCPQLGTTAVPCHPISCKQAPADPLSR